MQSRVAVFALAVLLAALVPAVAAQRAQIGYNSIDTHSSVLRGGTVTYTFTLLVAPPEGDPTVNLVASFGSYNDTAAIAPTSSISYRNVDGSASGYTDLGTLDGFSQSLSPHAFAKGQYTVQVVSTIQSASPIGSHTSYLTIRALEGAAISTVGIAYPFNFNILRTNAPPVPSFTFSPSGLQVSFDASQTTDPDADAVSFAWSFGDNTVGSGATTTHTYAGDGSFTVTLTATDALGASATKALLVTIASASNSGGGTGGSSGGSGDSDGDGVSDASETAAGSDPHQASSTPADLDGDGRTNESDNCPRASNADQADADGDRIGDPCDLSPADGPDGDADGDGKANRADNCPSVANADQSDTDGDHAGDACDSDRDGDGAANGLDAFPDNAAEQGDTDGDGVGDRTDADADADGISNAAEAAEGTNPLDRNDPPWLPAHVFAIPDGSGGAWIGWDAPVDARVERYLLWREASPVRLIASVEPGTGTYHYHDLDMPDSHVRYYVQPQFSSSDLLFKSADAVGSDTITLHEVLTDGCPAGAADSDKDGLCDTLEAQWKTNPRNADTDGDGISDLDEVKGTKGARTLPTLADSDGDGARDDRELALGFNPLDSRQTPPPASKRSPVGGAAPLLVLLAALALAQRRRR